MFSSDFFKALINFSINALQSMQVENGLFCLERIKGNPNPIGISVRYSLMTLLGLKKAHFNGYSIPFNLDDIESIVFQNIDTPELKIGDYGLYLWINSRCDYKYTDEIIKRLDAKLLSNGGFNSLEGQQLCWIIIGLALTQLAIDSGRIKVLLKDALDQLMCHNQSSSGLFYHHGIKNIRRRFPNFATQIYSILALSTVAELNLDDRALCAAKSAADCLIDLQLPDQAWPWIFDSKTKRVVEPYEIYSVHQDAMAPMALLTIFENTGESTYRNAAISGLNWLYGQNDLNFLMIDKEENIIYRSIRRKKPWDRLSLYFNTMYAYIFRRSLRFNNYLEVNKTCRPYHLGWILEAWCGREDICK